MYSLCWAVTFLLIFFSFNWTKVTFFHRSLIDLLTWSCIFSNWIYTFCFLSGLVCGCWNSPAFLAWNPCIPFPHLSETMSWKVVWVFFFYAHIFCCHLLALCIKVKRLCVMIFLHSFYLCFLQYSLWRISRVFSIGIRRFCAKSVQSTDTVRGNIDCIKPNICLIPVLVSWYRRLISFLISKKEPILFFFYSDLFAYDSPQHSIR